MNICFDNVDFSSSTGPNNFALKLRRGLKKLGHAVKKDADLRLVFTRTDNFSGSYVQRLDGIDFNSEGYRPVNNGQIKKTYKNATAVAIQSRFDEKIVRNFLGEHANTHLIHNGTDLEKIASIGATVIEDYNDVWSCASMWSNRPNKRLKENIEYFLEFAGDNACMMVCGDADEVIKSDRVKYVGMLSWEKMISIFKRSSHFVHLALVDHCPNVVIDAKACGCKIICSSMAGTEEIAGEDSIVVEDMEWDYKTPFDYKRPPKLDFSRTRKGKYRDISLDIEDVAKRYVKIFKEIENG